MKKQFKAWAIDSNQKPFGFIGRYWRFESFDQSIPEKLEGCESCLFKTRKVARGALRSMKRKSWVSFPNARVRRVLVTIEIID